MSGPARWPGPEPVAPVDVGPDVHVGADARSGAASSPFADVRRRAWPRLHGDVLAVVFVGGCVGGCARYAVGLAWGAAAHGFPVATLAVNLTGSFLLALLVVVAAEVRPSRYLRPLLGTGFCGAFTTFSAVVVSLAQLLDHGRYAVAAGYLGATVVGGLAAACLGLAVGRAATAHRRRVHGRRSA